MTILNVEIKELEQQIVEIFISLDAWIDSDENKEISFCYLFAKNSATVKVITGFLHRSIGVSTFCH